MASPNWPKNIIHTICLLLRLGKTLLWWSAMYTLETIACIRDQLYQEPWIGCIKGWKCLSYKRHIGCVWWSKTLWSQRTYWVLHTLSLVRIHWERKDTLKVKVIIICIIYFTQLWCMEYGDMHRSYRVYHIPYRVRTCLILRDTKHPCGLFD